MSCAAGCDVAALAGVGSTTADLETHNAAVQELSVDVNAETERRFESCAERDLLGFCLDERFEDMRAFQAAWTDYAARWNEFFVAARGALVWSDPDFNALQAEYNQKRMLFRSLGGATSAPAAASTSDVPESIASLGSTMLVLAGLAIGAYFLVGVAPLLSAGRRAAS